MAGNDYVFRNWVDAAANAPELMRRGEINPQEYWDILARARAEQGNSGQQPLQPQQPMQRVQAPAPQIPPSLENGGRAAPQQQPNPLADPMNGRAIPNGVPLPSWEQVQRFMREIAGPRPAY
jgi:hypothetical protein